jgi:hypothetical protein
MILLSVGLMLGTRMWYAMWDAEQDDDIEFERRMDGVVREIGDRGKPLVPEAVTPFREPTPAPAPALATAKTAVSAPGLTSALTPTVATSHSLTPAPAPVSSLVTSTTTSNPRLETAPQMLPPSLTPNHTLAPSMQESSPTSATTVVHRGAVHTLAPASTAAVGANLSDIMTIVREEREIMMATMDKQREEMEAKMEAKVKQLQTSRQVTALQARLEALYDAKLLDDDEVVVLEDQVADAIGVATDGTVDSAWECVMQMIKLSEGIASEKVFARQLRRKFM